MYADIDSRRFRPVSGVERVEQVVEPEELSELLYRAVKWGDQVTLLFKSSITFRQFWSLILWKRYKALKINWDHANLLEGRRP